MKKDESFGRSDAIWIRRYLSVPKTVLDLKNGFLQLFRKMGIRRIAEISEEVAHTEHSQKD